MPVINSESPLTEILAARPQASAPPSDDKSPRFASLLQQIRQLSGKGVLPADASRRPEQTGKNKKNHQPALSPAEMTPPMLLITPDSLPARLTLTGFRSLTTLSAGSGRAVTSSAGVALSGKATLDTGLAGKIPLPASTPGLTDPADELPAAAIQAPGVSSLSFFPSPLREGQDKPSAPSAARQPLLAATVGSAIHTQSQRLLPASSSPLRQGHQDTPGTASLPSFSLTPLPEPLPKHEITAGNPVAGQHYWQTPLDQQILFMRRNGVHAAELRLHPRELGSLKISLVMNNDRTDLAFMSDHSQVRSALEAALPQLRHALAESGVNLGQSHIGREPPPPSFGFTQSDHSPDHPPSGPPPRQDQRAEIAAQPPVSDPLLSGKQPVTPGVDLFA